MKEQNETKSTKIQTKDTIKTNTGQNETSSKPPTKKIKKSPENWVQPSLIVKIKCKDLAKGKYYNEKGKMK